jgi:hypothetical protein
MTFRAPARRPQYHFAAWRPLEGDGRAGLEAQIVPDGFRHRDLSFARNVRRHGYYLQFFPISGGYAD